MQLFLGVYFISLLVVITLGTLAGNLIIALDLSPRPVSPGMKQFSLLVVRFIPFTVMAKSKMESVCVVSMFLLSQGDSAKQLFKL